WDDLKQRAKATITLVRYGLTLAYRVDDSFQSLGSLQILKEELTHINRGDAPHILLFPHSAGEWRSSVLKGRRTSSFISTDVDGENTVIRLHQDGNAGLPKTLLASSLPRTVLSSTNAAESPTALLTRREMQSWRLLQLEPSSLRRPDRFSDLPMLGIDGSHLPATLDRLARSGANGEHTYQQSVDRVSMQISNRLAHLIDDVRLVWVERDERQHLLTAFVTDRSNTSYPAQSLSDGTLRFLALAVLELDPEVQGVICLEEPENGISPGRIPAILQLLQDIAVDVQSPVGPDNPLRQVIINTHSPAVVQQVPDDSLLVATLKETVWGEQRFMRAAFAGLSETWRDRAGAENLSKGNLLVYLNPVQRQLPDEEKPDFTRVMDRPDVQQLMLPFPVAES
ncbi:MAG: AAA family ATPase, partial [Anaerolineae bacterium]|nr:AAA family ATPase [Anaerolineae bacterium]